MSTARIFDTEIDGKTMILVPLGSVSSLAGEGAKPELERLLQQLQQAELKNVVVDFLNVSYFGTIMLAAMHTIWKHVRSAGGKMALCNLSAVGREVLQIAGFDKLWPICDSRAEALETIAE
jgi:anti-anti-sigma factor